jgi:hypothetical protein
MPKLMYSHCNERRADARQQEASSFRGVRSEPTPAPIKAKPAEQKYHDEDDQ